METKKLLEYWKKENDVLVKCPLCGECQYQDINEGFNTLLCNIDQVDGCGEYFVVKVSFSFEITFEMKYFNLLEIW